MKTATRLHESGITSNRGSACCGESVLMLCTDRPSHPEILGDPKRLSLTFFIEREGKHSLGPTRKLWWSRNKVAVEESVAEWKLSKLKKNKTEDI